MVDPPRAVLLPGAQRSLALVGDVGRPGHPGIRRARGRVRDRARRGPQPHERRGGREPRCARRAGRNLHRLDRRGRDRLDLGADSGRGHRRRVPGLAGGERVEAT